MKRVLLFIGQFLEPAIECSIGFREKRNNKVGYFTANYSLTGYSEGAGVDN